MKCLKAFFILLLGFVFLFLTVEVYAARGVRNVVPFNRGSTEKGEETKDGLENKIRSYKRQLDGMKHESDRAGSEIPENMKNKKFSGSRDAYLYFDKHHYSLKQKKNKMPEEQRLERNYYVLMNYYYVKSEIDRMEKKLKKYK